MAKDLRPDNVLDRLIINLKQLPGIGEKTATRLAYFILRQPEHFALDLADAVAEARQKLHSCLQCCNFTDEPTCAICASPQRTDEIICVVEEPSDLTAFERARQFTGKYHVLHGAIS